MCCADWLSQPSCLFNANFWHGVHKERHTDTTRAEVFISLINLAHVYTDLRSNSKCNKAEIQSFYSQLIVLNIRPLNHIFGPFSILLC